MEATRRPREVLGGPGGFADAQTVQNCAVTICHGPYTEELPVGGMTVAEIRTRYADRFDIDPLSQAIVDGQEVRDGTVIRAGQMLMFMRRAGEKG